MATSPTARAAAKLILHVFVAEFDAYPGETLRSTSFYKAFSKTYTIADFTLGAEYGVEQGWIDAAGDMNYRLTAAGYAEATNPAPEPEFLPEPELEPEPFATADRWQADPASFPPGTITLEPEEAEFILRFVSGQSVTRNLILQERIKTKILAESARIAGKPVQKTK